MVPRPAATVILVRDRPVGDNAAGVEVFMIRRSPSAAFVGGAYVFPGGGLDAADASEDLAGFCAGMDDAEASRLLEVERGGLAYWIAAIRECFEEAGLLLACEAGGQFVDLRDPKRAAEFELWRDRIRAGEATLADLCREHKLRLAVGQLAYFSHWITQPGRPRRYDTRFLVAPAPPEQIAAHDNSETVDHAWMLPADALERNRRGEIELVFPTIKTLEAIAGYASAAALLDYARSPCKMPTMAPRSAMSREGRKILLPSDFAYAEVGRLDPDSLGTVSCEIIPGTVVRLSDKVRRLTAPNPGVMTGPGTNTYLVGSGEEFAVIDPGPPIDSHIEAILAATGGNIRWVLCTHTHKDHSPAAILLKARTGAILHGMPPPPYDNQDQSFRPDRVLKHGEMLEVAGCTLRVIHTPGHASNQVCYFLGEEKLLFTGDHVMQGSTVVINPPDGDMRVYLDSLRLLQHEKIDWFAPGHGFLMGKPQEVIERLLIHRLARENKVVKALRDAGAADIDALVPEVYDDVHERLYPVAARSLLAHLQKLEYEGRATTDGSRWSFVDE